MISTVCFVPGLTMTSEAGSSKEKSGLQSQGSTLNPPYCTGTCSGDMYLYSPHFSTYESDGRKETKQANETTKKKRTNISNVYLKRVSADLDGPANTNLLFDLGVMNGPITV